MKFLLVLSTLLFLGLCWHHVVVTANPNTITEFSRYSVSRQDIDYIRSVSTLKNQLRQGYEVDATLPFSSQQVVLRKGLNTVIIPPVSDPKLSPSSKTERFAEIFASSSKKHTSKADNGDDYLEFLPMFSAALPITGSVSWNATCFQNTTATFQFNNGTTNLDGQIHLEASNPRDHLCVDIYLVATPQTWRVFSIFKEGQHSINIEQFQPDDAQYLEHYGLQTFEARSGALGMIEDLIKTAELFAGPWERKDIVQFMEDYMNVTMQPRQFEDFVIDESYLKSGDYLAIQKMSGEHGGENLLELYGTGSRTGHAAALLWMNNTNNDTQTLFVVESIGGSPTERNGIIKTEYKEWMAYAMKQTWLVSVVRPQASLWKDDDAAVEFFNDAEGLPYGFHNYLFGWLDTLGLVDNVPTPANPELLVTMFSLIDRIDPSLADLMWGQALNKRLHTVNLTMADIFEECEARNTTIYDLISIPEIDGWEYSDGRSMVCDVFVVSLFKAAGVFGNISSAVNAVEFTPRDSLEIEVYEPTWTMPSECVSNNVPCPAGAPCQGWCQMLGPYVLDLTDGFNSLPPYAHSFEHCPGLPPKYERPSDC
eukprot:TRINITY_DN6729_c0_g1_i1.p1 TRINITY_DN6729_c0_g1~~TRINITY_DN6729_c0_g1_i1.p1  ORF type:complete len:594 (+),score=131.47 TRINITY_DN6729_c0_g1_i1:185-1966(+)